MGNLEERRQNLKEKIEQARQASPSNTLGGAGGTSGVKGSWQATGGGTTQIVASEGGRNAQIVQINGTTKREIDQARQAVVQEREIRRQEANKLTSQQDIYKRIYGQRGYSVYVDKNGYFVAESRGKNQKIVISPNNKITRAKYGAKINTSFLKPSLINSYGQSYLDRMVLKRNLEKIGYSNVRLGSKVTTAEKNGKVIYIPKDMQKTLIVPKGAKVDISHLQTKKQTSIEKELKESRFRWKDFKTYKNLIKPFFKYPLDVAEGYKNIIKSAMKLKQSKATDIKNIIAIATNVKILKDELYKISNANARNLHKSIHKSKKRGVVNYQPLTLAQRKTINTNLIELSKNIKKINKPYLDKAYELATNDKTQLAGQFTAFLALGTTGGLMAGSKSVATAIGGKLLNKSLSALGLYVAGTSTYKAIKKPTAQNVGEALFINSAYAISSLFKLMKRLSPTTRATVKNANALELKTKSFLEKNRINFNKIKKNGFGFIKTKRITVAQAKKQFLINQKSAKYTLEWLKFIKKNPSLLHIQDLNPRLRAKVLLAAMKKSRTLIHSTSLKPSDILKQKIQIEPTRKGLLEAVSKLKPLSKVKDYKSNSKIENAFLKQIIKEKGVLYGGKAMELYTSKLARFLAGRGKSPDFDVYLTNAGKKAPLIAKRLNSIFKTKDFKIKKGAYNFVNKLYYKNKAIADLNDFNKMKMGIDRIVSKIKYTTNKQGLRVLQSQEIVLDKLKSIFLQKKIYGAKITQSLKDIKLLSKGKITKDTIIKFRRNPRGVFETVKITSGAGKSRTAFKEFYFYTDTAGSIYYSKGKKGTLLVFPKERIGKLPNNILKMSNSSAKRIAINNYIKKVAPKFFPPPSAVGYGYGESEFIAKEGLKRFLKYKTAAYDKATRKFIPALYYGVSKPKGIALVNLIKEAYGKHLFTNFKLRFTSPDLLTAKKYIKMFDKGLRLSPYEKNIFLRWSNKVYKGFTKKLKALLNSKKAQINKIKIERTQLSRNIAKIERTLRRTINPRERAFLKRRLFRVYARLREVRTYIRDTDRVSRRGRTSQREERTYPRTREISRTLERARLPARTTRNIRTVSRTSQREIPRNALPLREERTRRIIERVNRIIEKRPKEDKLFKLKSKKRLKRLIIKSKRRGFIYLADLAAILYGVKASKKESQALLKKGRIFTGFEQRKIVRR
jgi:hypothetical protein